MEKLASTRKRASCISLDAEDHNLTVAINLARHLFGPNAALAVAYCAIDARLEGRQEDFQIWTTVFKKLRDAD